jgi:hypothetical protein
VSDSRFRRLLRWMWSTDQTKQEADRCPLCNARLIGRPTYGTTSGPVGGIYLEPSRQELIAACPVHGQAPFNTPTAREQALDERGRTDEHRLLTDRYPE